MLSLLYREGDLTATVIADRLGITERSVRRILQDLEREGYIEHSRRGRNNAYRIHLDVSLRRSDRYGITIGELLRILRGPGDTQPSDAKRKPHQSGVE